MSASARTEHPEEVKAFIDFMVNSEEAGKINLADRGLPANETVREAVLPELSEADTAAAEFVEEIQPELGEALRGGSVVVDGESAVIRRFGSWFEFGGSGSFAGGS